jgi:hypothetical protein
VAKRLAPYRVALSTAVIVAVLIAIRALLFAVGIDGLPLSPLASAIIAGALFVMGLVVAGTLSDYKDAERAPSQMASSLHAILREDEAIHAVWGRPDLPALRERLVAVVATLRSDINLGDTRDCLGAVEALSASILELEDSKVPPNYIARLRQEQAAMRAALLRVYHIQREQFLPSARAMVVSVVVLVLAVLMFTDVSGEEASLVTLGFLSFFFIYLARLINVMEQPFRVGNERTEDDVSLFLLSEFVVQAQAEGEVVVGEELAEQAEVVEEQMVQEEAEAAVEAE